MMLLFRVALIWMIVGSTLTLAAERRKETFRIEGKNYPFIAIADQSLTLSEDCFKKSKTNPDCAAYGALGKLKDLDSSEASVEQGATAGSWACGRLGAEIVVGTQEDRSQTGFCRFKDGSLIGLGSLTYHLLNPESRH